MITDQSRIISFLASPVTHGGAAVEQIETHASIVFLTGELAYKLKRAVRFDYLDFSTPERRRTLCEAELRLNRRTAPMLYRRVLPVTSADNGSYALGGAGTPVEWLVEMNRFPQEALFDRLAAAARLHLTLMSPLAAAIAEFHRTAERRPDHGGRAGMAWVVEGNAAGFHEYGGVCLEPLACTRVIETTRRELERGATRLDERREAGFVRQCHGDLHLRNIVLLDGRPTLFDGVEFNDAIACTDVLYDLSFLLMDLWRRRLPAHANAVWNRYLGETGDLDGVSLLPLFLSCRAAVRAKTSATAAQLQEDPRRRGELQDLGREYLSMAEDLLNPPAASIVAVGGFSGAGKSTLARALAPLLGPVPGAIVLRSDEVRKQLCGVPLLEHLGSSGYSPATSARVYATLAERATRAARNGHSVIVDAVFARPSDRQGIQAAAALAAVPFVGLWLDAPQSVLISRVEGRRHDLSDADATVIRRQIEQGPGEIHWSRLDTMTSADAVLHDATASVRRTLHGGMNTADGSRAFPGQAQLPAGKGPLPESSD